VGKRTLSIKISTLKLEKPIIKDEHKLGYFEKFYWERRISSYIGSSGSSTFSKSRCFLTTAAQISSSEGTPG